ncbi:hypothetical protein C9374_004851 [Naegleria lovaniensis]|uniref:PAS domain-containing protein n=1 Tax=Naegleria lovaniensis TaxID=51637 RepID=A0AA88GPP5_NAELO|nr:uncharacterized protein C9374_004851 [Naegleria lovaniensis]KAG2382884.1 hypothetical protein C9374_004851 [Naegleria lovaniensis]
MNKSGDFNSNNSGASSSASRSSSSSGFQQQVYLATNQHMPSSGSSTPSFISGQEQNLNEKSNLVLQALIQQSLGQQQQTSHSTTPPLPSSFQNFVSPQQQSPTLFSNPSNMLHQSFSNPFFFQQSTPQQTTRISPNANTLNNHAVLATQLQNLERENQLLKQENQQLKNEFFEFVNTFLEFKNCFLGRKSTGLGVIITSGDTGKILTANSCVIETLGYKDLEHFKSCVSKWSDVVIQEDRQRVFATFLQSALSNTDNCFIIFRAKRFDGKIITLSSNHQVDDNQIDLVTGDHLTSTTGNSSTQQQQPQSSTDHPSSSKPPFLVPYNPNANHSL